LGIKLENVKSNFSYSDYPVILMVNPKIISSIHNEKIFLDLMNEVKNLPSEGYALSINNRGVVIIG
jgi:Flp pilus assembly secretin CpaC